jgi:vacuolar-type H+-ATPase subunit D/Vma8
MTKPLDSRKAGDRNLGKVKGDLRQMRDSHKLLRRAVESLFMMFALIEGEQYQRPAEKYSLNSRLAKLSERVAASGIDAEKQIACYKAIVFAQASNCLALPLTELSVAEASRRSQQVSEAGRFLVLATRCLLDEGLELARDIPGDLPG